MTTDHRDPDQPEHSGCDPDDDLSVPDELWQELEAAATDPAPPEPSLAIRRLAQSAAAFYLQLVLEHGIEPDEAIELTHGLIGQAYHNLTAHPELPQL